MTIMSAAAPVLRTPELVREVLCTDFGVVLKEHVGHFAPCNVGKARVESLDAECSLQRLDHVIGPGVGAETEQNAFLA